MIKCTFENGNAALLRHVAVHAIAVKDQKVLFVKRAPHLTNGGLYALPGGYLDRDETTAAATLRELKEETGYDGKVIALFAVCDNPNRKGEDRQNVTFDFLIKIGEQTGQPDNESSEVKWFDLSALPAPSAMAFDHLEHIQLYQKYAKNPASVDLPILMSGDTTSSKTQAT